MKKVLFTLAMMMAATFAYSQNVVRSKGMDGHFEYQPDAKAYGLSGSGDINEYICFKAGITSNLKFGSEDQKYFLGIFGAGVHQRIVLNDMFLVQGRLYPYIGYSSNTIPGTSRYDKPTTKEKFTYGAAAELQLGFKLWSTSGGDDYYFTAGYQIRAGEFKTDGMFKYGNIMADLTVIL